MKLVTAKSGACTGVYVENASKKLVSVKEAGLSYETMEELVIRATDEELAKLQAVAASEGEGLSLEEVTLLAPIPKLHQDVICLGINYMEHAEESYRYKKEKFDGKREDAVYFSKRVHEAVAPGAPIDPHTDIVGRLDYEAEMAVIIRKDARNVKAEDAADYVFGYTILNDVSAREIQNRHKQWYFGKSLDGFTPMGPCIVTKDEFAFPPATGIRSYVNGELRQNSNTANMIFKIDYVIEELSRGMTLEAGTVIATGTPSGVGMGFDPPKFMKPGDEVICEIDGIGRLINPIEE